MRFVFTLSSSAAVLLLSRLAVAAPPCVGPCAAQPVPVEPSPTCCFEGPTGTCKDPSYLGVCLLDPYCCNTAWDAACIDAFEAAKGWSCPPVFEGDYDVAGHAQVGAYSDLVCEESTDSCLWLFDFQLPAGRTRGSRGTTGLDAYFECEDADGDFIGGGGGGSELAPIEILYGSGGVLRGIVRTDAFSDLDGACEQSVDGILFEVRPPASNDCAIASTQPGCEDVWTETCVCYHDPYCCSTAWDLQCVNEQVSC